MDDATAYDLIARGGRLSDVREAWTDEADAFQKELKIDIDLAKRKGWVIDVPNEWEV